MYCVLHGWILVVQATSAPASASAGATYMNPDPVLRRSAIDMEGHKADFVV
jgi:hypothetical protein